MNSIRVNRRLADGSIFRLGTAVYYTSYSGWRFIPNVAGRNVSRKFHSTWEKCLPRWVGYPDRCETQEINSEAGL